MEGRNNFLAIIIGAVIIGGCVYFGLKDNNQPANISLAPLLSPSPTVTGYSNISWNSRVAASVATSDIAPTISPTPICGAEENTIVTKVIDGDTVVVEGGYHVRLLGMDADEKGYPCYDAAKTRLESLVLGKQVKLEKDKTDVDQYGRCLRYIFAGSENVDVELVKDGLAVARFYDDVKYRAEITEAEKQARQNKTGCKWAQ